MSLPTYFKANITLDEVENAIDDINLSLNHQYPCHACYCVNSVLIVNSPSHRADILSGFKGFKPVTYGEQSQFIEPYFIPADDLKELIKWWNSKDPDGWLKPEQAASDAIDFLSSTPDTDISPAALEQAKIYVERRKLLLRYFRSLMEQAINHLTEVAA